MIFTLVPAARAAELRDAVACCTGCVDPDHPVHAVVLGVEETVTSGTARRGGAPTEREPTQTLEWTTSSAGRASTGTPSLRIPPTVPV